MGKAWVHLWFNVMTVVPMSRIDSKAVNRSRETRRELLRSIYGSKTVVTSGVGEMEVVNVIHFWMWFKTGSNGVCQQIRGKC